MSSFNNQTPPRTPPRTTQNRVCPGAPRVTRYERHPRAAPFPNAQAHPPAAQRRLQFENPEFNTPNRQNRQNRQNRVTPRALFQ